jgi:hypothetical protein
MHIPWHEMHHQQVAYLLCCYTSSNLAIENSLIQEREKEIVRYC